jgi:hypothetical protein
MRLANMLIRSDSSQLKDITEFLIAVAKGTEEEQRRQDRTPYFCPVTLKFDDDTPYRFSAFTREICSSGVGLLHPMDIKPGEVTVTFRPYPNEVIRLAVQIHWCQPCGEGWYISGGTFVRVVGQK